MVDKRTRRKFGEHEKQGKDGKHQPDELKDSTYDSKHYICQQEGLKTLYLTAFMATVEKVLTYALGEHDPGSAKNGRTSSKCGAPVRDS